MWNELDKFEDTKKGVISSCKWKDRQYNDHKKKVEDTKGVISSCKWKNRQYNDQKKRTKRQTMIYKAKDKATRTSLKSVRERRYS
jgi:hypothetical protein